MNQAKHRFVICLVIGACFAGVIYRGYTVLALNLVTADPIRDRDALRAQRIRSPRGAPFHFDADADIVLGVGPDGQPGKADWDDNANGQTDDPGELGAVGGDDVCLGPADEGYDEARADDRSIVISKGGFVPRQPATESDIEIRYRSPDEGWLVLD